MLNVEAVLLPELLFCHFINRFDHLRCKMDALFLGYPVVANAIRRLVSSIQVGHLASIFSIQVYHEFRIKHLWYVANAIRRLISSILS